MRLFLFLLVLYIAFAQQYYWEKTLLDDEPLNFNQTRAHIYSTSAREIKATIKCSENCDVYLMILSEYNKMKLGQNFNFIERVVNNKIANFEHNNSYTISQILCAVTYNPSPVSTRLSFVMLQFIPIKQHRVWQQTMHSLSITQRQSDMRTFNMLANEAKATVTCNFVCHSMILTFTEYQKFLDGMEYTYLEAQSGLVMSFSVLDENLLSRKLILVIANRFQPSTIKATLRFDEHLPAELADPTVWIVLFFIATLFVLCVFPFCISILIVLATPQLRKYIHYLLKRRAPDENDRMYML